MAGEREVYLVTPLIVVLLLASEARTESTSNTTVVLGNATTTAKPPSTAIWLGELTTGGTWGEQPTPPPELCWDTIKDRRPLMKRATLHVAYNTPLLSCQTFCMKTYNTCTLLAFSASESLCKLYDTDLDIYDMSMDPTFITQRPVHCVYDFLYIAEESKWSEAQSQVCPGLNGRLASVMNESQLQEIVSVIPTQIQEVWLGVKIADGQWMWDNGVEAVVQRYFRESSFSHVADDDGSVCGKGVIRRRRKKLRTLHIQPEDCERSLPAVCQSKDSILPTDPPTIPPTKSWWLHDFFIRFVQTTYPPITIKLIEVTNKTVKTTRPPIPTLPVPVPEAKTSGPFSTNPVDVSIGALMTFIFLGVVIVIVILDLATISKEFLRLKANLSGVCANCNCERDDGTFDPPPDLLYYSKETHHKVKDSRPNYRIPVSLYRDYDQMFHAV